MCFLLLSIDFCLAWRCSSLFLLLVLFLFGCGCLLCGSSISISVSVSGIAARRIGDVEVLQGDIDKAEGIDAAKWLEGVGKIKEVWELYAYASHRASMLLLFACSLTDCMLSRTHKQL